MCFYFNIFNFFFISFVDMHTILAMTVQKSLIFHGIDHHSSVEISEIMAR